MVMSGVKPFYLYMLPLEQAHMCPVRALVEWMAVCKFNTSSYIFRRILKGDQVSREDSPMVKRIVTTSEIHCLIALAFSLRRHFSSISGTLCSTSVKTPIHMVPTLSGEEGASGYLVLCGGPYDAFVTGEGGVKTSRI